jgi:hypothetical protein
MQLSCVSEEIFQSTNMIDLDMVFYDVGRLTSKICMLVVNGHFKLLNMHFW